MHEKVFSEGEQFSATKYNEAKKIAAKISCGKISVNEISSDDIERVENIMHRNLTPLKFHAKLLPCPKSLWLIQYTWDWCLNNNIFFTHVKYFRLIR